MRKKKNAEVMGSDSIDPKAGEEIRKMDWKFVISLGLMLIFIVIAYYRLKYPTSVQVVDVASSTFAIEGATTVNAKIAGEIHRFVCYHVTVSDFWLFEDPKRAELIGAEEAFTSFLQPDGSVAYQAIYYQQLDENKGLKVVKDFMDCGTSDDRQIEMAGVDIPLSIDFDSGAGYFSGILDIDDKKSIPTVVFD
jgi:hypothetical protein